MKKILAIVMTVAMILSMSTVLASALKANLTGTAGVYSNGQENFAPVGDITVAWKPAGYDAIDLTDGSLEDWAALGLTAANVTPDNMVAWVGSTAPEGWKMSTYFFADETSLYVGFYITDPDVVPQGEGAANYQSGDCFQINIDFGRKLGWILENDPDTAEILGTTQNIFYSFGYRGDGAPLTLYVQQADQDREIGEANGVKGSTGKTDDGWCAEFCLPFQIMYDDYAYKSYVDDPELMRIYVGGNEKQALEIGAGLYYCNNSTAEDGTVITNDWAAGTHSGFRGTDADGNELDETNPPIVRWDAYDNAMSLILEFQEGMTFTSENIEVVAADETIPPEVIPETDPETAAPETDPETAAPETTPETTAGTTADETTAGTTADETTAETTAETKAEGGCASVVGFGAAAILVAAAAVVLKKKD